jgi:predicted secreted hydrolase
MAFRMRDKRGGELWAGGSWRDDRGTTRVMAPADIAFTPLRHWQSQRTGTRYPVAFRIGIGALEFTIEPLLDDQENDTRATTGAVYWEGAVRALRSGRTIGKGYLELTGYQQPLAL